MRDIQHNTHSHLVSPLSTGSLGASNPGVIIPSPLLAASTSSAVGSRGTSTMTPGSLERDAKIAARFYTQSQSCPLPFPIHYPQGVKRDGRINIPPYQSAPRLSRPRPGTRHLYPRRLPGRSSTRRLCCRLFLSASAPRASSACRLARRAGR
jgi:hypothetical protein